MHNDLKEVFCQIKIQIQFFINVVFNEFLLPFLKRGQLFELQEDNKKGNKIKEEEKENRVREHEDMNISRWLVWVSRGH